MNFKTNRPAVIFTLAVVIIGSASMVLAQDGDTEQETTVTGQLTVTAEGGYALIEQESGESVSLRGPDELLADYVGALVKITGTWDEADDGTEHLAVTSVERATS